MWSNSICTCQTNRLHSALTTWYWNHLNINNNMTQSLFRPLKTNYTLYNLMFFVFVSPCLKWTCDLFLNGVLIFRCYSRYFVFRVSDTLRSKATVNEQHWLIGSGSIWFASGCCLHCIPDNIHVELPLPASFRTAWSPSDFPLSSLSSSSVIVCLSVSVLPCWPVVTNFMCWTGGTKKGEL